MEDDMELDVEGFDEDGPSSWSQGIGDNKLPSVSSHHSPELPEHHWLIFDNRFSGHSPPVTPHDDMDEGSRATMQNMIQEEHSYLKIKKFVRRRNQGAKNPVSPKRKERFTSNNTKWTETEKDLFKKGIEDCGHNWKEIAKLIKTRTRVQVKNYAWNYLQRQAPSTDRPSAPGSTSAFHHKRPTRRPPEPATAPHTAGTGKLGDGDAVDETGVEREAEGREERVGIEDDEEDDVEVDVEENSEDDSAEPSLQSAVLFGAVLKTLSSAESCDDVQDSRSEHRSDGSPSQLLIGLGRAGDGEQARAAQCEMQEDEVKGEKTATTERESESSPVSALEEGRECKKSQREERSSIKTKHSRRRRREGGKSDADESKNLKRVSSVETTSISCLPGNRSSNAESEEAVPPGDGGPSGRPRGGSVHPEESVDKTGRRRRREESIGDAIGGTVLAKGIVSEVDWSGQNLVLGDRENGSECSLDFGDQGELDCTTKGERHVKSGSDGILLSEINGGNKGLSATYAVSDDEQDACSSNGNDVGAEGLRGISEYFPPLEDRGDSCFEESTATASLYATEEFECLSDASSMKEFGNDHDTQEIPSRRALSGTSQEATETTRTGEGLEDVDVNKATPECTPLLGNRRRAVTLDPDVVTEGERLAHPEFFRLDSATNTPERYLTIRNHILECWQKCKPAYLMKTAVREGLARNVNLIGQIHGYLESIGAINAGRTEFLERPKGEILLELDTVTDAERAANHEFFDHTSSIKTPERYLAIRNHIIKCWQKWKPRYLNKTSVRGGLRNAGDVNIIGQIHSYLETVGAINFGTHNPHSKRSKRRKTAMERQTQDPEGGVLRRESVRSREKMLKKNQDESEEKTTEKSPVERPKKSKKPRASAYDPFKLVECHKFSTSLPAPFSVKMNGNVVVIMDLHSHLSTTEVIGLVGGRYDHEKGVLDVRLAKPCKSLSTGMQCEMDPVSQTEACESILSAGASVVGWYHSHPTFAPNPSVRDIETQGHFQEWFSQDAKAPFVGIIVSPYHSRHRATSTVNCITVSPEWCPVVSSWRPYKFDFSVYQDHEVSQALQELTAQAAQLVSEFAKYKYRVEMLWICPGDSGMTYLEKMLQSLYSNLCGSDDEKKDTISKLRQLVLESFAVKCSPVNRNAFLHDPSSFNP